VEPGSAMVDEGGLTMAWLGVCRTTLVV